MPLWAQDSLRVATYNVELARKGPGLLLRDITRGKADDIRVVLDDIGRARADILVLQGFDYDLEGRALTAFATALRDRGLDYPYLFAAPPNAGRMTSVDLNGDGKTGGPQDAQGYGRFFGQGAMALLSVHPIDVAAAKDFSTLLWRDLPRHIYPMAGGVPWGDPAAFDVIRLAAHGIWDVPVDHPTLGRINILTFHASPPVFDGPEDRNGRRNHDEVMFWHHYLNGQFGPAPQARFVLMGDANLDPDLGESRHNAIQTLLADPRMQDPLPGAPTVHWEKVGRLRVDYVLPSADWTVRDAGLLRHPTAPRSHALVWVDLTR